MPRPRTPAGEMGKVRFVVLANGQVQAHARMRVELGELRRLKAVRVSEEEAQRKYHVVSGVCRSEESNPRGMAVSLPRSGCWNFVTPKQCGSRNYHR